MPVHVRELHPRAFEQVGTHELNSSKQCSPAHISVGLGPQAASTQVVSVLKRVNSAPASRVLNAVRHGQKGPPMHID